MNELQEFDGVTGGCLWGCAGDSIDGHAADCNWHDVARLVQSIRHDKEMLALDGLVLQKCFRMLGMDESGAETNDIPEQIARLQTERDELRKIVQEVEWNGKNSRRKMPTRRRAESRDEMNFRQIMAKNKKSAIEVMQIAAHELAAANLSAEDFETWEEGEKESEAELAALMAERDELRKIVQKVEWNGYNDGWTCCPVCYECETHSADCRLAAALKGEQ